MTSSSPKVFISYSHDSKEHADRVLKLSDRLRAEGVDCDIDQYEPSPPEGWLRWMMNQIEAATYILVVCTQIYYQRFRGKGQSSVGKGVTWEGAIITNELYDSQPTNTKFVPILSNSTDAQYIPEPLRGATHYIFSIENGYESLYRQLTNQPKVEKPELGKLKPLTGRKRTQDFFLIQNSFPQMKKTNDEKQSAASLWEKYTALSLGVLLIVCILILAVFFPEPTPFQYTVFRIVIAIACAGFASILSGMLDVRISKFVRVGGALSVLALVYFFSPASIVSKNPDSNHSLTETKAIRQETHGDKSPAIISNCDVDITYEKE